MYVIILKESEQTPQTNIKPATWFHDVKVRDCSLETASVAIRTM